MKLAHKFLLSIGLLLILLACSKRKEVQVSSPTIKDLADSYIYNYYIRFHPEKGTLNDVPNSNNSRLGIPYERRIFEERAAEDSLYNQLVLIEPELLNELDQTTYYNLKERLEALKGIRICNQYLWSFNYLEGFQTNLERLASKQKVECHSEKRALIDRWKKVPELIDVEIANNSKGMEQGYALPSIAIENLIGIIGTYLETPVEESLFYEPAKDCDDPDYKNELKTVISNSIYPAFLKLKTYLTEVYLPHARSNFSAISLPDGSECYLAYARYYTSLKLTKEQLVHVGDSLFHIYEQGFLKLGEEIYGVDKQEAILKKFYNDPENFFADYNELEQQLKSSFELSQREVSNFISDPPNEPLVVKKVPKNKEGIDANAYYSEATNKGDTATMYFDYMIHSQTPRGFLEAAVFHEGIPGHHFQHAFLHELKDSHLLNRLLWNAGYGEGWAMYTESAAKELGWYSSPKSVLTQYFYTVNENLFLNNFLMYRENDVDQLYNIFETKYHMDRSMTNNQLSYSSTLLGYQLSYGIGNSFIRRLRIRAENALGDDFDLKDFHKECLRHGNIPLTHLERLIYRWIENRHTHL